MGNRSQLNDDGFQPRPSAFGIRCPTDGRLVSWTDRFDGCAGNFRFLQSTPMAAIDQAIFQWPTKSILRIDDQY